MLNFEGASKDMGKNMRRIDEIRRLLSHPHGVCEYMDAVLRVMATGTSTQVVGIVNHFLLVIHAYHLRDITLDERLYKRYTRPFRWEPQTEEEDGLNVLFVQEGQVELLRPLVNNILADVDDEEELVAEEARKFLFTKFSEMQFKVVLLRLCIAAIMKYSDLRCRRDCALLFRVVCDRIYLPYDDAVKIRDQVERDLDNDEHATECASMLPLIEARIESTRPKKDDTDSNRY